MLPISYLHRILNGAKPSDFATTSCLRPIKLRITSSDTAQPQDIICDCGKCLRCQDNSREQWVSRMCLHSFGYKYCYFVTLTYGSYNLHIYDKHPFKRSWLETYPVYDDCNSTHKMAWSPSLCCIEHIQKYFKRLRKSLNTEITFTYCSEYGSTYSRPHFHLIVWSNTPISKQQFHDAWSYDVCYESPTICNKWTGSYSQKKSSLYRYYGGYRTINGKYVPIYYRQNPAYHIRFYIGNIDYHNLTENGSMNWNGKPENANSARNNAFSYVCKYIGKKSEIPPMALKRMEMCFSALPFADFSPEDALYEMDDNFTGIPLYDPNNPHKLLKWTSALDIIKNNKERIKYKYLCINKNRIYEHINFEDFTQIFAPSFGCSRKNAIGKNYFIAHLTELSQGCTDLPKWQGKNLTFPTYFARLLSEQKYPLRYLSHNLFGSSYSKGSLPRIYEYFSELRADSSAFYRYKAFTPFEASRIKEIVYTDTQGQTMTMACDPHTQRYTLNGDAINPHKKDSLANPTLFDPLKQKVHYQYIPHLDHFEGYAYDPHTREYTLVDYIHRIDFCDIVLNFINDRWEQLPQNESRRKKQLQLYDLVHNDPDTSPAIDRFIAERKQMQQTYKARHAQDIN